MKLRQDKHKKNGGNWKIWDYSPGCDFGLFLEKFFRQEIVLLLVAIREGGFFNRKNYLHYHNEKNSPENLEM